MATTPSVRVVKNFPFRAGSRDFSNRYHFNGGVPANDTQWHALFDAIVLAEKAIYTSETKIVECVGYLAGSDVPVSSKTYTTAGTLSIGSQSIQTPGQTAGLLRWSTTARSSKNHPIYLFNYFHAVWADAVSSNEQDIWASPQRTAVGTYAGAWISGFSDGVHTCVRAGPNGATATGQQTEEYLTHRDFPRLPSGV